MKLLKNWLPAILLFFFFLLVWEFSVIIFDVPNWLLPAPSVILFDFHNHTSLIIEHSQKTILEIISGLFISLFLAFSLSVAISWSSILNKAIFPFVITSQIIPIFTLAPLIIVWFGTGIASKIIVIVLFTFFPVVITTFNGLKSSDKVLVDMFKTLGANKLQIYTKLYIPNALPQIFSGIKVASVLSVIGAVIGEWIGSSGGLGWLIKLSGPQFKTERIFAAIVTLSIIALSLYLVTILLEKFFLKKYPKL